MLKKSSIRKIILACTCLLVLLIIYLFPKNKTSDELVPKTNYSVSEVSDILYLLDSNNYVSRINIILKKEEITDKALELIDYLTVNSTSSVLLPNEFKGIIPKDTKVNSTDLKDGNFKIDFSKELLTVDPKEEMHMIEAILYSLTSLERIKNITILVDGTIFNKLPSTSSYLPNPLDRSYGINKE